MGKDDRSELGLAYMGEVIDRTLHASLDEGAGLGIIHWVTV